MNTETAVTRPSFRREVLSRLLADKISALALIIIGAYFLTALLGEAYSYYCHSSGATPFYELGSMDRRFQPPSTRHWLGTDYRGRDVFWRALSAVRTAIKVGVIASLISALIGVILGTLGGYFGGRLDELVVWFYSVFASIPTLLFILAFALLVTKGFLFPPLAEWFGRISAVFQADPGMLALYLGIGFTGWVSLCQIIRAETLRLKQTAYVQAAQVLGCGPLRIIWRHLLPNLAHLVIIYVTIRFAYAVMTEVIVSYLGLGVEFEPSWGAMIANGQERLWQGVWWEVGGATLFMFFLVLALNLLGDALRDVLDPRLKP